jgi:diguanylate cyclase (GGDEF)-like protein/PAS domain S-box-containing protein
VSDTSIDDTPSRILADSDYDETPPHRFLRICGLGVALWLMQALTLLVYPGIGVVRPEFILASLLAVGCTCGFLVLLREMAGWTSMNTGALAGGGTAVIHVLLLAGLSGGFRVMPAGGVVTFVIAAATLTAFDWNRTLAADRWTRLGVIGTGIGGFALIQLVGLAAPHGGSVMSIAWTGMAAGLWCGSLGLLVGVRLGDLSLLASPASLARRERFRVIAEALPIPIVLTSAVDHAVLFTNDRLLAQFRLDGTADPDRQTDCYYVRPEDQRLLMAELRRQGSVENYEIQLRRLDGSTFWALLSARAISFSGESAILATLHDISARKEAEAALLASEIRYALISRAANDGIWDWDIPSGGVYYSTRWKEIVGVVGERGFARLDDWLNRVHPDDIVRLRGEIDEHIAGRTPQLDTEYRILHGDGRYCWMQCRAIVLRNSAGAPIQMAGSQSDITLRKTYEINLLNAAYEDRLTGVHNRAYFNRLVETRDSIQSVEGTAILLFNIDQFRRLNDTLGNGAGDALLIAMARRLVARLAPADALARIGSDEFAVWIKPVRDGRTAVARAVSLLADLTEIYELGDIETTVAVSVGVATPSEGNATNGTDLLRNARLALDRAKMLGGARSELFDHVLLRETNLKQRLSKDLASAERLDQIFFEYQPVVSLDTGGANTITGFETLMRWRHPELGAVPAGEFIPLAEEGGTIVPLGLLAIETAAGELARWNTFGLVSDGFAIAVNLSNRQISDRAGVLRMHATLDGLAIERGRLQLEITESVLMNDPEAMATTLAEFKERGIELSLDDFGTGYSSLSYLHRFPLDILKIDQSFVSRMLRSPEALRLVRSIIELAHDLGLKVIAEGVEAAEECGLLRQLGCDYAQGYYFSRPVSSEQAQRLLERRVL